MYFIQYSQGRKVCDGYAPTVERCLALMPGNLEFESRVGDECKYSDPTHNLLPVVYIRPTPYK